MTLENLFTRLQEIDRAARELIRDAWFCPDTGIAEGVCLPADDPDTRFLKECAELLPDPLEDMHGVLFYLGCPVSPEHVLERFPNGHYGCRDGQGIRHESHCGHPLEAKIMDMFSRLRWVMTRIEHDGSVYFPPGHRDVPPAGLPVRERGRQI